MSSDLRFSRRLITDVNSVFGGYLVIVGGIAYVSELHAVSILRV
jgi:hypothetical protein